MEKNSTATNGYTLQNKRLQVVVDRIPLNREMLRNNKVITNCNTNDNKKNLIAKLNKKIYGKNIEQSKWCFMALIDYLTFTFLGNTTSEIITRADVKKCLETILSQEATENDINLVLRMCTHQSSWFTDGYTDTALSIMDGIGIVFPELDFCNEYKWVPGLIWRYILQGAKGTFLVELTKIINESSEIFSRFYNPCSNESDSVELCAL